MTKIIIQKMLEKDLPVVSELAMLANPHAIKEKYAEHIMRDLKANPDLSFVAVIENQVIGYAQAEAHDCEEALLEDIAVAEKHQGKGVGERLLVEMVKALKLKGTMIMFAEVHYKCAAAIPFYYRHGFFSGFGHDYFGISHDAIILKRALSK